MKLFNESHAYKTEANATAKLEKTLALVGRTLDNTRWFIAINAVGRFVPVVSTVGDAGQAELIGLAYHGVSVI